MLAMRCSQHALADQGQAGSDGGVHEPERRQRIHAKGGLQVLCVDYWHRPCSRRSSSPEAAALRLGTQCWAKADPAVCWCCWHRTESRFLAVGVLLCGKACQVGLTPAAQLQLDLQKPVQGRRGGACCADKQPRCVWQPGKHGAPSRRLSRMLERLSTTCSLPYRSPHLERRVHSQRHAIILHIECTSSKCLVC